MENTKASQGAPADVSRAGGPDDSRSGPTDTRAGGPDDSRDKAKIDPTKNYQDGTDRAGGPDDSRSMP